MIRRLTVADHDECFQLLEKKSAENLFIIGDIEGYGYNQTFQKVWGDFDASGKLIAVLLKYEGNYIPYAEGDFDAKGFANLMDEDSDFSMMSGLKEVTEKIEPHIKKPLRKKRQTFYAKCTKLLYDGDFSIVQQATPDDALELVTLLQAIPEFDKGNISVETKRRGLVDGTSRAFYIKEDGKMVSTASTAAENSKSAMIVGVATLANYKNRGYATKCVLRICHELLQEGKELCLFYDNPKAGAIYKRIGFEDIGYWMMYSY